MISEKQFLEAMSIVKEYQEQVKKQIKDISYPDTLTLCEWSLLHNTQNSCLSPRLLRILSDPQYHYLCIKDINKKSFKQLKGLGAKCWTEFAEATGKNPHI